MGIQQTKLTPEEEKLLEDAVEKYNSIVEIGTISKSDLVRMGIKMVGTEIMASDTITIQFKK